MERPDEEEIHFLFGKYGKPVVRKFYVNMHERDEVRDYPECKGGARIAVKRGEGVVMIATKEGKRFGLPGGRIWVEESVEDGAIREVFEETGLKIELVGMPELHKCQYLFKDWNLERWIFVFIAQSVDGTLDPRDSEEIGKIAVFREPPSIYERDHWLHSIWNKCLSI